MSKSARISYVMIAVLLVLIGGLHMATLLLTVLFGYFALNFLSFGRSKLLGIAFYLIVVASIGYGFIFFSRQAYIALPEIAEKTIPAVVGYAEKRGIELPFTDYASLKTVAQLILRLLQTSFAKILATIVSCDRLPVALTAHFRFPACHLFRRY